MGPSGANGRGCSCRCLRSLDIGQTHHEHAVAPTHYSVARSVPIRVEDDDVTDTAMTVAADRVATRLPHHGSRTRLRTVNFAQAQADNAA
jgi:hypothetical protein